MTVASSPGVTHESSVVRVRRAIVTHWRSGSRAATAAQTLRQVDFEVCDLDVGLEGPAQACGERWIGGVSCPRTFLATNRSGPPGGPKVSRGAGRS